MQPLNELVGQSQEVAALRDTVAKLLERQRDSGRLPPILILGETGSGKGALARAIHRAGPRAAGPFVDVNCAAIPETLLEAELFGYERGAFTDARQAKPGLFQAAHAGTIFLDEIGLLPEALQGKLLKVIEERAVRRLGSTKSEQVDVALLAATAEDLGAAVRARRFREDLYHRLAVVTVEMPPLRARGPDIVLLAEHFLDRACLEYRLPRKILAEDARAALARYEWPGNVRELGNVMERVALLADAPLVTAAMLGLPEALRAEPAVAAAGDGSLEARMREHLLEVLERTGWNISRAAAILGIARNTLRARIEKYGLRSDAATPRPAPSRRNAPAAGSAPAPASLRWEPRRLTLLCAAVRVPPALDSQVYASGTIEVLVEKIRSFGGRIEELSPTEMLAAFGLEPTEDAPVRAAHAALAIQRAARDAGAKGERPDVRVGIHVGQFLVGRASDAAEIDLGAKRDAWAALEALLRDATADSITVSEVAAPFLERRFDLVPVEGVEGQGRYRIAGLERTGFGFGRQMSAFVGRDRDLETLHARLAVAMTGQAQAVGIVGEAGIGKSRLVYEFRESLRDRDVTYREGRCVSYGSAVPYLPVLDMLRQNFRMTEADSAESIAKKVHAALNALEIDLEEWAPYIFHLLGVKKRSEAAPVGNDRVAPLSPEALKARTFETLRQVSLHASRQRPLIYVIEDLHWVDRTSEECMETLIESLGGAPILFLATYRPGYRPPWMDKSYATQLALQPLSADDAMSVVRSVLRAREVPDALARLILLRAEGNPFFLEELSRTVREEGELRASASVPNTVQEVLLARLDRLPAEPRRLLQTAAILGREVSLRLLGAIWEGTTTVEPHLRELMRLEFLFERTRAAEPVLVFKHALTQEVAYESLPPAQRQTLHARAARALEVLYADRLEEVLDRLAHHYSRAEDAPKAVEYLTRVAARAARGHAHTEAMSVLRQALVHAERLPPPERDVRQLDLVVRQATSLFLLGRIQETCDLLDVHEVSVERTGDPRIIAHFHYLLGRGLSFLGEHERARRSADRAIDEAGRVGDQATVGKALGLLALEASIAGEPLEGIEQCGRAIAVLEAAGDRPSLGLTYWLMGVNQVRLGDFADAHASQARALAIAEETGDRRLQTLAIWGAGIVHAASGEWAEGIAACQRSLACSPDPLHVALATGWLGYAHLERGDVASAIPLLEQATRQLGEFRFLQFHGLFGVFLADACRRAGQVERALALAVDALGAMRTARFGYGIGCAERTLGRIAHSRGAFAEAEMHLGAAREAFAAIRARYDLAVTDLDLATLALARGNANGAADDLARARETFEALGIPRYVELVAERSRGA